MPRPLTPSDAVLARAAELRAAGLNWEAVAAKLHRCAETVRKWPLLHPARWRTALHHAERRLIAEASAESVLILRQLLRSEDEKVRRDAARFLVELRLEMTRHDEKHLGEANRTAFTSDSARLVAFLEGHSDEELDRLTNEMCSAAPGESIDSGASSDAGPA